MERKVPLVGASDHNVSEAVYLSDPEGNGVEIYADRPPSSCYWRDGTIRMGTKPLDIPALLERSRGARWDGAPTGTQIGHVHLQVGTIEVAEEFYARKLGLDVTCRYPGRGALSMRRTAIIISPPTSGTAVERDSVVSPRLIWPR